MTQAECPSCHEWSEVVAECVIGPVAFDEKTDNFVLGPMWGPFWWRASGGCPCCGEIVLSVEGDCEFRVVPGPRALAPEQIEGESACDCEVQL